MRKKIELAVVVCCFGLVCLCAVNADKAAGLQDTPGEKAIEAAGVDMQIQEEDWEGIGAQAQGAAHLDDGVAGEALNGEEDKTAGEDDDGESEYDNLAIADVTDYVNVRSEPNTDSEIVGRIYDGAVAEILATAGEQGDWFRIVSGNVEGYIKAEFFLYGMWRLM